MTNHDTSPSVTGSLFRGVTAGLAGAWLMTQVHTLFHGRGVTGFREPQSSRPVDGTDEDATTKIASVVADAAGVGPLTRREKSVAGPAVHYGFGAAMGALLALVEDRLDNSSDSGGFERAALVHGPVFGVLIWAAANQAVLPLLGLSEPPDEYAPATHAELLATHLVFGAATGAAVYGLRTLPRPGAGTTRVPA